MQRILLLLLSTIWFSCQAQVDSETVTYEKCDTLRTETDTYILQQLICHKITLKGDTTVNDTTNIGTLLPPIGPNDLILIVQAGQSVMNGHPTSANNIGMPPAEYDTIYTNGTQYYLTNAGWRNYTPNPSAYGPDVSMMARLDSIYPGQIKLIKYAINGTRLRTDTRSNKYDWNVNSTGENWDRMIRFSLGDTSNYYQGLEKLQNENPGKNIRLLSFQWGQGESDSNLVTDAGDSLTLSGTNARLKYEQDLMALYSDFKLHVSTFGIDTTECVLQIMELGPGSSVTNRVFYNDIRQAQENVADILTETDGIETYDGTHYSIKGNIEVGKLLADDVLNRISNL